MRVTTSRPALSTRLELGGALAAVKRPGVVRLPGLPTPAPASGKLLIVNKGVAPYSPRLPNEKKNQSDLMVVDLKTGRVASRVALPDQSHELALSADGRWAAIPHFVKKLPGKPNAAGSAITLLDLERKKQRLIELPGYTGAHGLQWLDADRVAVTVDGKPGVTENGFILEVNLRTSKIERELPTRQADTHLVKLSKDKKTYFATDLSGTFTAIDRASGKQTKLMRTGDGTEGFDLSPDGKELWVAASWTGRITVLDAKTLERKGFIDSPGGPLRVLFTPDGKNVLVSHYDSNDVAVIDARTRKEVTRIPLVVGKISRDGVAKRSTGGPIMAALHPTAHQGFVASEEAGVVTVFDTKTWKVTGYIKAGTAPDPLAFVG